MHFIMAEFVDTKLTELRTLYNSDDEYYKYLLMKLDFCIYQRRMEIWTNDYDKKINRKRENSNVDYEPNPNQPKIQRMVDD